MPKVHVKFFAILREMTAIKSEWREIAEGTSVESLWRDYAAAHPRIANLRAAYAVNQQLATPEHVLHEGDEVAFLPPVSGGAKTVEREKSRKTRKPRKKFSAASARSVAKNVFVTRQRLDLNALYHAVAFPGAGAIITFSGVVRDNAHGKAVDHLEYEAYPEMAEQTMRAIIAEIKTRWSETRVAIAHRVGRLKIGEASLVIAVASPHRPEAYAASRYAIERVKVILPVWKKEFWMDGEHWVEGPIAGELSAANAEKIVAQAENAVRQAE